METIEYNDSMDLSEKVDVDREKLIEDEKTVRRKKPNVTQTENTASSQSIEDDAITSRQQQNEANGSLSAEDLQMLEIENKQMISEFKGLSEEV